MQKITIMMLIVFFFLIIFAIDFWSDSVSFYNSSRIAKYELAVLEVER